MFHGTDQPEAMGAEKGLGHPKFGLKGQNFPNFLVIDSRIFAPVDSFYLFCTPLPNTDIGGLIFWILWSCSSSKPVWETPALRDKGSTWSQRSYPVYQQCDLQSWLSTLLP